MKTRTSRKGIAWRSLLLLPLITVLLFGFSETKKVNIPKKGLTESHIPQPSVHGQKEKPEEINNGKSSSKRIVEIAGLVLDAQTLAPLENVEIYDSNGKILSKTDNRGYYAIQFLIVSPGEIFFEFSLGKKGYKPFLQKEHWGDLQGKIKSTIYFGLQKNDSNSLEFSELFTNLQNLSYESIQSNIHFIESQYEFNQKLEKAKHGNQDVFIQIDNEYYLVNDSSWIKMNSIEGLISINDDKIVSASLVNNMVERKEITGMSPLEEYEDAHFVVYTVSGNINSQLRNRAIQKFNTLAKKYNAIPVKKRSISPKDLKILEAIYRNMSFVEKEKAEAFPIFSVSPSPPNQNEKERADAVIQEIVEKQDPYDLSHIYPTSHSNLKDGYSFPRIYLNGGEISYFQMLKMEKEGQITSMNIITKPIGKDTVKIIELNGRGH